MADVSVNLSGQGATSAAGALAPTADASVSLDGQYATSAAGRLKMLPRAAGNIGTPALVIPPPPGFF